MISKGYGKNGCSALILLKVLKKFTQCMLSDVQLRHSMGRFPGILLAELESADYTQRYVATQTQARAPPPLRSFDKMAMISSECPSHSPRATLFSNPLVCFGTVLALHMMSHCTHCGVGMHSMRDISVRRTKVFLNLVTFAHQLRNYVHISTLSGLWVRVERVDSTAFCV